MIDREKLFSHLEPPPQGHIMTSPSFTDNAVVIFTRFPVPGETKTRLIPDLGADGAARVQREMTEHAVRIAQQYCDEYGADLEIRYDGSSRPDMAAWLGEGIRYAPQGSGDLGCRMKRAATEAISHGATNVIIIGVDIPDMHVDLLRRAFRNLEKNNIVIGPATDGGYYLIGFSAQVSDVFECIEWGTDRVFEQTIDTITGSGLSLGLLEVLDDIDRPEDLPLWEKIKKSRSEEE